MFIERFLLSCADRHGHQHTDRPLAMLGLRDIAAFFASNRYALVSGFVAVSDLPLPWHLEKSCLLELNRLRRLLLTASKADATCPHFGGMHIFLVSRSLVFNHAIQS